VALRRKRLRAGSIPFTRSTGHRLSRLGGGRLVPERSNDRFRPLRP